MAKSVLKCNAISQITPWVSISKKLLKITRWPELLIGKNSVKPCISPSIIDFINIFNLGYYSYRSNEAGVMLESISVTAFSVNKFCQDSSKMNVSHKAIKIANRRLIIS